MWLDKRTAALYFFNRKMKSLMMNKPKKVVLLAITGTFVEWFDYGIYGYMVNRISVAFFPSQHKTAALLLAFCVFSSGFLVRPLGALIFGYVADRRGRRTALLSTMLLMAFSTLLMGVLPTYASAGILAAVLLLMARLAQSLAVAGENGVPVFIIEHSKKLP